MQGWEKEIWRWIFLVEELVARQMFSIVDWDWFAIMFVEGKVVDKFKREGSFMVSTHHLSPIKENLDSSCRSYKHQ